MSCVKVVKETVLWTTDTTFKEIHKEISANECWALQQTTICGENRMTRQGNVWAYVKEPEGEGSWNSVTEFKVLNCELETVTLEQECLTCPVIGVTGELAENRKVGYAIQGQRTFVWNDVGPTQHGCEVKRTPRRIGMLYNDSGAFRVRDPEYQMDFVLGSQRKLCDLTGPKIFSVIGEPKMGLFLMDEKEKRLFNDQFVYQGSTAGNLEFQGSGKKRRAKRAVAAPYIMMPRVKNRAQGGGVTTTIMPNITDDSQEMPNMTQLDLQSYLPEHLQWMTDTLVEHENIIIDALNALECREKKAKVERLFALSQFSGILAARVMKMKMCTSLESFGTTAVLRQCEYKVYNFKVDNSSRSCGPQPRDGNWAVGKDGFMAIPYTECFWRSSIINFNGEPYEAKNGRWTKTTPGNYASHQFLLAHFNESIDFSGSLLSAAMEKEHAFTFNLMTQLAVTMDQHGIQNVGSLVESVSKV